MRVCVVPACVISKRASQPICCLPHPPIHASSIHAHIAPFTLACARAQSAQQWAHVKCGCHLGVSFAVALCGDALRPPVPPQQRWYRQGGKAKVRGTGNGCVLWRCCCTAVGAHANNPAAVVQNDTGHIAHIVHQSACCAASQCSRLRKHCGRAAAAAAPIVPAGLYAAGTAAKTAHTQGGPQRGSALYVVPLYWCISPALRKSKQERC